MKLTNTREKFYYYVLNNPGNCAEVAAILKEEGEESGIYELCSALVEIGLNVDKHTGVYREEDIQDAIRVAKQYIAQKKIEDIAVFMDNLFEIQTYAVDMNEKREVTRLIIVQDNATTGGTCKYIDFSRIPLEVRQKIKAALL